MVQPTCSRFARIGARIDGVRQVLHRACRFPLVYGTVLYGRFVLPHVRTYRGSARTDCTVQTARGRGPGQFVRFVPNRTLFDVCNGTLTPPTGTAERTRPLPGALSAVSLLHNGPQPAGCGPASRPCQTVPYGYLIPYIRYVVPYTRGLPTFRLYIYIGTVRYRTRVSSTKYYI